MEIYGNGFVRVGAFLTSRSAFERLCSIRFEERRAGEGVLVIGTDRQVHTLVAKRGGQREGFRGRGLESAGRNVLLRRRTT